MNDWSLERLQECIDTCWYADITDEAKRIMARQLERYLPKAV